LPKRRSKTDDPLGFGSYAKAVRFSGNKMTGRLAEDNFAVAQRFQGHDVRKIHKGGDFVVQKRDMFGRKIGKPTTHEIKTGNATLTPAQKRKKKRLGRKYRVERYF
jgi:hypothetical protein